MEEELKPCGQIYLTEQIMTVFQDILGVENGTIEEIS